MPEVIGIDHIYITVTDLAKSEPFYDLVFMQTLGFRKNKFPLGDRGEPHIQYYNRHFGYVLRPARSLKNHDPYSPGLHHFCLRVNSASDVHDIAKQLRAAGIELPRRSCIQNMPLTMWRLFLTIQTAFA